MLRLLSPLFEAGLGGRLGDGEQFEVLRVEAMREHYARTIRAWLENFEANLPAITTILTAEQVRVWRLYLAGGALAFEQGRMGADQILAVKPQGPSR
jgi:cyclopropane-fatty-acyl-phospholipid synthase